MEYSQVARHPFLVRTSKVRVLLFQPIKTWVGIAQLVERQIVALNVTGSIPVLRPFIFKV